MAISTRSIWNKVVTAEAAAARKEWAKTRLSPSEQESWLRGWWKVAQQDAFEEFRKEAMRKDE